MTEALCLEKPYFDELLDSLPGGLHLLQHFFELQLLFDHFPQAVHSAVCELNFQVIVRDEHHSLLNLIEETLHLQILLIAFFQVSAVLEEIKNPNLHEQKEEEGPLQLQHIPCGQHKHSH